MTSSDWAYISNDLVYVALVLYTISFIAYTYETAFAVRAIKEESVKTLDRTTTLKSNKIATAVFLASTVALGLAVLSRGISAERVPLGNMYEYSITGAFTFALAYLVVGIKHDLRWLGLPISIIILLILGTAITLVGHPRFCCDSFRRRLLTF